MAVKRAFQIEIAFLERTEKLSSTLIEHLRLVFFPPKTLKSVEIRDRRWVLKVVATFNLGCLPTLILALKDFSSEFYFTSDQRSPPSSAENVSLATWSKWKSGRGWLKKLVCKKKLEDTHNNYFPGIWFLPWGLK